MKKLHFGEYFRDLSVAFAMFVAVFVMAPFFTKKGRLDPERAGAPGAVKKSSQLFESRLKAKNAGTYNVKDMLVNYIFLFVLYSYKYDIFKFDCMIIAKGRRRRYLPQQ